MRRRRPTCPVPPREGVAPTRIRLPRDERHEDLARFLTDRFAPHDSAATSELFARGDVYGPDGHPLDAGAPYEPGSHVWVFRPLPEEPDLPDDLPILYEDEYLLVVDKPHGLPVTPRGGFVRQTAVTKLRLSTGIRQLSPAHRLDRLTAGVLLFAKTPEARGPLQGLFELQQVKKSYELIAPLAAARSAGPAVPAGIPRAPEEPLTVRSRIVKDRTSLQAREVPGAPNAVTGVVLLDEIPGTGQGLYGAYPLSGKTHQIRVHMAALGRPILGDPLYPEIDSEALASPSTRLRLLAREILLRHPFTGEPLCVRSDRTLEESTRNDGEPA